MLPTTHCNTIELGNERRFSDWSAIYNTPDSRLYRRLVELGITEAGRAKPSSKPVDELSARQLGKAPQQREVSASSAWSSGDHGTERRDTTRWAWL